MNLRQLCRASGKWIAPLLVLMVMLAATAALPAHELLTLRQALARVLEVNPGLLSQRAEVDKQALEQRIATGEFLPKLNLQADYTHYKDPYLVTPIHELGVFPPLDQDIGGLSLNLQQPLYTGGRLSANRAAAGHRYEAAEQGLRAQHQAMLFQTAFTYTQALQYRHLDAALAHRIQSLETQVKYASEKYNQGRASRLDVIRLQTRLSEARHDQVSVRQREQDARSSLAALLAAPEGLPPLAEPDAPPVNLPVSREAAIAEARSHNPSLQQAAAEQRAAEQRVKAARASRLPQVALQGSARQVTGADDGEVYDERQVGVTVSLPVFDGGVRRRQVAQAELARRQQTLAAETADNTLVSEVQQAFGGLDEMRSRLTIARQQEREAEEVLRIETLRYRQGAGVMSDLLSAEAAHWTAVASRLQAGYALAISQARLLKAMGALDPARFADTPDDTQHRHLSDGDTGTQKKEVAP